MTRGGGPEQRGMSQVARWLPASSELDFGRYRSMRQLRRRKITGRTLSKREGRLPKGMQLSIARSARFSVAIDTGVGAGLGGL